VRELKNHEVVFDVGVYFLFIGSLGSGEDEWIFIDSCRLSFGN
jgi:hypothetical protein